MRLNKTAILLWAISSFSFSAANADVSVVTSIKPVHSLVSGVMEGVSSPILIIEGAGSPHTYSLKPSQARQLQDADLVFWMGDELETFLEGPIKNIAKSAKSIKLTDSHGLKKIKFREGGMFEEHDDHDDHGGHDDHGHDKHAKDDHDDHGHDKHAKDDHDEHGHGEFDPHVWLDPINAKALVHEIEEALVEVDPKNAKKYEANADRIAKEMDKLVEELREQLKPVQEKGFIVFHDAYQYFEQRFGVSAIGSITVSPEVMPGAERVSELRKKIIDLSATCVFSEPQFEPKLVKTLVKGTGALTGVIDPLGASLTKGPDLYSQLIREMAASLKDCLSAKS